jgi:pimeloyl-ACP methyl ester carboxylesterase
LILASPYAGWAGSLPAAVVAERLEQGLRDLEGRPEDYVRSWIPSLFSPRASTAMVEEAVAIMREFHPAGARAMLHSMAEADLRPVLPRIRVPTLVLVGDADVRSPLPVARDLQAQIPGSTLAMIPGAGHQCNIEAADAFNDEVRRFLLPGPRP